MSSEVLWKDSQRMSRPQDTQIQTWKSLWTCPIPCISPTLSVGSCCRQRWGLEPHMLLVKSHLMMALGIKAPIVEETSLMHVGTCVSPRLNCSSQGDPEFPQVAFPSPAR